MRAQLAGGVLLAGLASFAWAMETAQWPPPPEVLGRMRDLQASLADPKTSKEAREAARAELESLLKSPAGQDRKVEARRPARAAIDPFPSVVRTNPPRALDPPVAKLEVVPEPPPLPRPTVNPSTGSVIPPSTGAAIDPRSGRVLHAVPGGYVDPLTGQFVPR